MWRHLQTTQGRLDPSSITFIEGAEFEHLRRRLQIEEIPGSEGGMPADVVEAVAEGVIFNSLDHLLDTHTTRVVALRPKLTEEERRQFLLRVFSLLERNMTSLSTSVTRRRTAAPRSYTGR